MNRYIIILLCFLFSCKEERSHEALLGLKFKNNNLSYYLEKRSNSILEDLDSNSKDIKLYNLTIAKDSLINFIYQIGLFRRSNIFNLI